MRTLKPGEINRQQLMEFIVAYKQANDGLSPTVRDMMDGCNLSSSSLVNHHIEVLVKQGKLRRVGYHRNLAVVGGRWTLGE